ncbi:protein SIEVE ELEMENT OCCLUSION C isoform X2 [Rhodamnia argentea]|uniref:Protein SIEVE ELEMENT OCCLUSION C isoform X2 n=1 Tax=Rhodamnia argentea TaxID=178133 RepID=A0A8B8Q6B4_9MYRT|nr:protein SIEVE ELEMENT OCCLUSION C isoform X2 [Rhodamnia argentea]
MSWLGIDQFLPTSGLSLEEDMLVRKLLLAHDPDGRHLDSELLLQAIEDAMCCATSLDIACDVKREDDIRQAGVVGLQEPLGVTIHRISSEMLCLCFSQKNMCARTLHVFDLLCYYAWDAKVVLVLAAVSMSYAELCLVIQLSPWNPLAKSVAILKQLQPNSKAFNRRLKALSSLIMKMLDMAKCIFKFTNLSISHLNPDKEAIETIKSNICLTAFWIVRSSLTSYSHMNDLMTIKSGCTNSSAIAIWELSSLAYTLTNLYSRLKRLVDGLIHRLEEKVEQKLVSLFRETRRDNQEVLTTLFSLKDKFPLKEKCSQAKVGISELTGKVVMFLISKPEFPSPEEWLLLVHQANNLPQNKTLEGNYDIVWVPISSSCAWTDSEDRSFDYLSNCMPWYSLRRPHLLSPATVNFIKQSWNYKEEPIMVVMDADGAITNLNAIDMLRIWGVKAYPFSSSREEELWEAENWGLHLMLDGIDQLLTYWIEQGKNVCIYGSDDLGWIKEFHSKMEIISEGVQLELVYVGKRIHHAQMMYIPANIHLHLSPTRIRFFWLRLESMRKSKLRLGKTVNTDQTLQEVSALLDFDEKDKDWAIFGKGSSADTIRLQGNRLVECLDKFPEWGQNVGKWGLLNAFRMALEPAVLDGPCSHTDTIPFEEGLAEKILFCVKCKRPMKSFLVYE